jgi:hypothetical protein
MGGLRALVVVVACFAVSACVAFDDKRLMPIGGQGGGGSGGGPDDDAGRDDGGQCVPAPEVCNGFDDDCDGVGDGNDPDALAYCEDRIVHARVSCAVDVAFTACVRIACDDGFLNCDGINGNGCEVEGAMCPCRNCEDDAGADDDAGR